MNYVYALFNLLAAGELKKKPIKSDYEDNDYERLTVVSLLAGATFLRDQKFNSCLRQMASPWADRHRRRQAESGELILGRDILSER